MFSLSARFTPSPRPSPRRACRCAAPPLALRTVKKPSRPEIPRKAVYRLSIYLRCLLRLKENGLPTIASEALARAAGVKSTQLRKDLAYFGTFGTRGLGYEVEQLAGMISKVLGTTRLQPVVLVGVGNLGAALLTYQGFGPEGFEVVAAFDAEPLKARTRTPFPHILPMSDLARVIRERGVRMAILTVPVTAAQVVANQLVEAGIVGVLNFAPIVIQVPEEVTVNSVNLAIELENLSYFIQG